MAINKRKVLEAARKFAQKGAKERALKEYSTLLKADPRDAKLLLEIGDAYRRWGQVDEAVAQYTRVADQYKQEGFDARAVAVYKQILNLDSKRYPAHVSLSELYQRMGLDAEAVAALQTAADGYHKEGQKREALDLLRRMSSLDPTNTTSRMKVADLLRNEGMEDDAVAEYESLVEELERQGALDTIASVYERLLEIQPSRIETLIALARNLIAQGQPERAEPFAKRVCDADPDVPEHCELLIDIYKELGRDDELNAATRELSKLYKARGDDEHAREILQRLPSVDTFELSGAQPTLEASDSAALPQFETAPPPEPSIAEDDDLLGPGNSFIGDESGSLLEDDELLQDDDFLMTDDEDLEPPALEVPAARETNAAEETISAGVSPEVALSEGDPDQLYAEASVYLRYGKRGQAIESLRGILAVDPDHRPALEKLGEAYAEQGDEADAVGVWSRAAELAREAGDGAAFSIVRDRIEALDAEAAGALGSPPEGDDAAGLGDDAGFELDLDVDVTLDIDDEQMAADHEIDIDVDISIDGSESSDGIELDLSDDSQFEAAPEPSSADQVVSDADGFDLDLDVDIDVDVDVFDDGPAVEPDAAVEDELDRDPPEGGSTTTAQQVAEDLEEAEFYFQQGLYDEAEAIYRRVLEIAPSHPSALLRMGEMAVARGNGPSVDPVATMTDTQIEGLELDTDPPAVADEEPFVFSDDTFSDDTASQADDADGQEAADEDAGLDLSDEEWGVDDDSGAEFELAESSDAEPEPLDPPTLVDEPSPFSADPPEPAFETNDPIGLVDDDEGGFDLAAELADSFDDDEAGMSQTEMVLSDVDNGFESIFSDFKKGVSKQLGDEDLETRYDLGIAYMEMGLHGDALAEFQLCLESEDRRLQSLHMMGLCELARGRSDEAAGWIGQALATDPLAEDEKAGLHFDMGRALQQAGNLEGAREAYEIVLAIDAGYPGIDEQVASLTDESPSDDAHDDGGLESFDDILSDFDTEDDDTCGEPEPEAPAEDFADVIAEAEAIEEEAAPPAAAPRGKKKKISFV